jgi:hypothetical protein
MRLPLQVNLKLLIALFCTFVLLTVVGTLSHELGHYAVMKWQGQDATIHYSHTTYVPDTANELLKYQRETWQKYSTEIQNNTAFPGSRQYHRNVERINNRMAMARLGGPVQTMLTGTIGLVLLFAFRRKFARANSLKIWQWSLVFLALFWLRQPANLVTGIGGYISTGAFSASGDEYFLSTFLGLPGITLNVATGILGFVVLGLVTLKFIPVHQRFTFAISGLFGGIFGYLLWLQWAGPVVLP